MSSSCSDHLITLVTRHELSNPHPPYTLMSVSHGADYIQLPVSRVLPYTQDFAVILLNRKYKEHSVVNTGIIYVHAHVKVRKYNDLSILNYCTHCCGVQTNILTYMHLRMHAHLCTHSHVYWDMVMMVVVG